MHDASRYLEPEKFDGLRFAKANEARRQGRRSADVPDHGESRLTDVSLDWPIWGFGNTAW